VSRLSEPGGGGGTGTGLPLPVALVIVSLFVLMAFETGQAVHDRGALQELRRAQEPTVEQAVKIRRQLQTLATKTAELAAAGDENAKNIVEQMKREGVTLSAAKK
jgi:hypothetical protein